MWGLKSYTGIRGEECQFPDSIAESEVPKDELIEWPKIKQKLVPEQ